VDSFGSERGYVDPGGEGEGLGLRHYLDVVRRRKWIVLAVVALAVGAALAISVLQHKTYRATTKIVVGQGNSLIPAPYAGAVQPYTATMADLVKSNIVAATVIGELGLNTTPDKLLQKISVSINPTTEVMTVHVTDRSKPRAVEIARHVAATFSRLVGKKFGTKAVSVAPGTTQLPLTAKVFDPAHADPKPVSPRPVRNIALGLVIGLVLGLVAAFLREHFDRQLRTREAVEAAFGVPVIGQIPAISKDHSTYATSGEVPEAFRALRANLEYLSVRRPVRTILVTSASPQQGKTTVAAHLALALAGSGGSTVAIEGDLRRPRLGELLQRKSDGPGLTGAIVGVTEPESAVLDVPLDEHGISGDVGRLGLLPSGPLPPNPSDLLSSDQMTRLLDRLAVLYDHVVIDSPPLLLVADGLELARIADGIVLVARRDETTRDEARDVRNLVERLGIRLLGVVFTDVKAPAGYGYESYARDERFLAALELRPERERNAR
jgi:capsular exopolysaccharide synthesis family protein